MGINYNKQTLGSGLASTAQMQDAEDQTEQSFLDGLSRTASGAGSNAMQTDLDMNSNDILNANAINGVSINATTLVVGGQEVTGSASVDASSDYNWTGQHTFTDMPTIGGFDLISTDTLREATITISTQTTTYTAVLADQGTVVLMNSASANSFNVPLNASVAYPVGATLSVCQYGAGATTIVPDSGVTVNTEVGYQIITQYGFATLVKIATNEWLLSGSLQASA